MIKAIFGVFTLMGVGPVFKDVTLCGTCFVELLTLSVALNRSVLQVGRPALACAACNAPLPLWQRMSEGAQRLRRASQARRMQADEQAAKLAALDIDTDTPQAREQAFRDSAAGWAWQDESDRYSDPDYLASSADMENDRLAGN